MTKRSDFQLPVRTSIDADARVIAWDPTDTNGEPFVVPASVLSVTALTVDANLLTRTAGVPAEITRANLAADAAFSALYEPVQVGTNTHIGLLTHTAITSGAGNSGFGDSAQRLITSGDNNTAVGQRAQENVTTGSNNISIGVDSQRLITTGASNVAVGVNVQRAMTTGSNSTAIGHNAQFSLTTGGSNTAVGVSAQQTLTTGASNVAVGVNAQFSLSTGSTNVAVGVSAHGNVTTGGSNTGLGDHAQNSPNGVVANAHTTASFGTSVGRESGLGSATQDDDITTIGYRALATGAGATSLGSGAHAAFTQSVALGMSTVSTAAAQVHLGSRHMEMVEITAPAAGATNSARIFAEDNGAGKTRLMVRFATGAVQQLAIQP